MASFNLGGVFNFVKETKIKNHDDKSLFKL